MCPYLEIGACRYNSVKMRSYWIRAAGDLVTGGRRGRFRQLTAHRQKAVGLAPMATDPGSPRWVGAPAGGEGRGRVPP